MQAQEQPVQGEWPRHDEADRAYKVLIADLVGLKFGPDGKPDAREVRAHIEEKGGVFHEGPLEDAGALTTGAIHFFYQPDLSTEAELLAETADGRYDALIAAATFIPKPARFDLGGVRIGAGTGNMGSASWGGGGGEGGIAPLMNTPGFNSRATAQMVLKAILKVSPDLPVDRLHALVAAGDFDTGRQLRDFPTEKLEGKRLAVIGYGNIGREVAKLGRAFGMTVTIYARERHQQWIESEGFRYASTPVEAASGAHFLSVHTGLGSIGADGRYANVGLIGADVLNAMAEGAVLVNYDRGEVVDAVALDAALAGGKVRHAAIDADLFRNAATGELSGPMLPYLPLAASHPGKTELLPHAAADTDHPSRVAGAKQAVDQIVDVIRYRRVTNRKGTLPEGFVDAGAKSAAGVGKVTAQHVAEIAADPAVLAELRTLAKQSTAIWSALEAAGDATERLSLAAAQARDLLMLSNRYVTLLQQAGLQGPAED